jgi:transcriptional regulator with GAF, ATPase, and Fis domain
VRGAFTGATTGRRGKFSLADGGSIFLDEIGVLSASLQPKLLRVLQEREFEPLGSERTERADVRVIAATNRDLRSQVAEGRFQEDLFYRLSVIPISIPPLRERRDDIPALLEHFAAKHAPRAGRRAIGWEEGVAEALSAYDWPGNVRELENTIERAIVLCRGDRISLADVALGATPSSNPPRLPSVRLHDNVEWAERESVRRALERSGGVKKAAADLLGLSQRALSYYLVKHKIE